MTGVEASCPQCGAPVRFGGARSVALACPYCRASLVRAGARVELAGEVPDLVAVDTRLAVGATGRAGGRGFVVLGRLQLSRGDATWNEWYASVGDAVGWLAEAEGQLLVTREVELGPAALPTPPALRPGHPVTLPVAGAVVVEEVGEATLVSFEGELPFAPRLGATYRYADATGDAGAFVTIDYGAEGDAPTLYAGREVPWAEVTIASGAPAAAGPAAAALSCPRCGAPVPLRVRAEARTATCPACHSLLDVRAGQLRWVEELAHRAAPAIPLGAKGTLRGEALEVIGWIRRFTSIDGETYRWEEYLLHGDGGYRWLSVYGGHWLLLRPIAAGAVSLQRGRARHGGRTYRHFQTSRAKVEALQGEFYWELRAGEEVEATDWVHPPYLLSSEDAGGEVSWTSGEHVPGRELWKALGLPGRPPRDVGVGAAEPNPWTHRATRAWAVAGIALAVLVVVAIALSALPRQTVLALDVPLAAGRVTLSQPFELRGGPQAIAVDATAAVTQAWVGLDVALVDDATGESEAAGIELSHYAGRDEDGPWQEDQRRGRVVIGHVRDGSYVLRVEPVVEAQASGRVPDLASVVVTGHAFLAAPLVAALLLVVAWPVAAAILAVRFENHRWRESDHPWGGG